MMGKDAEVIIYVDKNIEIHKDELERDFPRLVILNPKKFEKTGIIEGELSLFDLITVDDFSENFSDWIMEQSELTENQQDKFSDLFEEYLKKLRKYLSLLEHNDDRVVNDG